MRLVWVNGSFGCRTIAARTRDLILDTVPLITNTYSIIPVLLCVGMGSLTQNQPEVRIDTPPLQGMVLGTRCHAWVLSSPPQGLL